MGVKLQPLQQRLPGRSSLTRQRRRAQLPFLLATFVPLGLVWATFWLYPLLIGLWGGFTDWRGFVPEQPFIGLANYQELAGDALFRRSLQNAGLFTLLYVPAAIALALGMAMAVEASGRARPLFRMLYFLPFITSVTATALIWAWLYQPSLGLFNQILALVGLPEQRFLRSPAQALPSIVVYQLWKELGFNMVLCIAGLAAIDRSYYEAARVDGAGGWQIFRRITLPLLQPTLALLLVTNLAWGFQVFGPVFVMSSSAVNEPPGGPLNATLTVAVYQWQVAFRQLRLGYGAAIGTVVLLITLLVTLLQARLLRRNWEY
jgi:multiple sugar transport system permease protein